MNSAAVQEVVNDSGYQANRYYELKPGIKNAAHRIDIAILWHLITEKKRRVLLLICGAHPDRRDEFYHTPNNADRLSRIAKWEDLPKEWQDKVFNFVRQV